MSFHKKETEKNGVSGQTCQVCVEVGVLRREIVMLTPTPIHHVLRGLLHQTDPLQHIRDVVDTTLKHINQSSH